MINVLIGYILSMIIGIAAYERKTLNESGVLTAIFIGTLIFAYGGWFAFLFLLLFFWLPCPLCAALPNAWMK
jgi:uncharacterized membrane protein